MKPLFFHVDPSHSVDLTFMKQGLVMMKKYVKVLVMDKDLKFLKIADEKLSGRGFHVFATSSAQEAIKILKNIYVDSVMISNTDDRYVLFEFIATLKKKPVVIYNNPETRFDDTEAQSLN